MGASTGVVLVFPDGGDDAALATELAGGLGLKAEGATFEHGALGASSVVERRMGHQVCLTRIPTSRFLEAADAHAAVALVRALFEVGTRKGALLGFVTRFEHLLDEDELDHELLIPLLSGEYDELVAGGWEWFTIGAPLFGKVPLDPEIHQVASSEHAITYQRALTDNPWDLGVRS